MHIDIRRRPSQGGATLGDLVVTRGLDPIYRCITLEDQIREIPGQPAASWKIPGKTAIPAGTYKLLVTLSARFKCALPLLVDVEGFTGIRIHVLNVAGESDGCIGPGKSVGADGISIAQSRVAFNELFGTHILGALNAGESVTITIHNPPNYQPALAPHTGEH